MMKFEYRDAGRFLRTREYLSSASAFIVLAGLTVAALWLLVAPSLLGGASNTPVAGGAIVADANTIVEVQPNELLPGIGLIEDFQVSLARDPFRPLITEETDGTGDGGDDGFEPGGTRVSLIAITTAADGSRRAVVRVEGTDYTVGVGETFAGSYVVVSLTDTGGTFLFGDNPFTLAVGEEILK